MWVSSVWIDGESSRGHSRAIDRKKRPINGRLVAIALVAQLLDLSEPRGVPIMLKAIMGSALGGLMAGAVAIVASAPSRSTPAESWPTASTQPAGVVDQRDARAAATDPSFVECEPHQRAELHRVVVNGRELAQVACASALQPGGYTTAVFAESQGASDIVTLPAAASRTVVERPVIVRERVVTREPARRTSSNRSWTKTALVIGGSTGAGAGVGGLVGGKKGALVGAAIGGGSAAIFEAVKRR